MPTSRGNRNPSKQVRRQREHAAYAARYRRRRGWVTGMAIVAALGIAFITILAYTQDDGDTTEVEAASQPRATTSTTSDFNVPCPEPDGSSPKRTKFRRPPPFCLDLGKDYQAEVETDAGVFLIDLHENRAPETVNNFVFLARYHFYDGLVFDKGVPDFYIQMGKPVGSTNPGYFINDELPEPGQYQVRSVIMANAGPNTNGSQFIVLTGASHLGEMNPPRFPLFGEVVGGWEVVQALAADTQEGGVMRAPHVTKRITIIEE